MLGAFLVLPIRFNQQSWASLWARQRGWGRSVLIFSRALQHGQSRQFFGNQRVSFPVRPPLCCSSVGQRALPWLFAQTPAFESWLLHLAMWTWMCSSLRVSFPASVKWAYLPIRGLLGEFYEIICVKCLPWCLIQWMPAVFIISIKMLSLSTSSCPPYPVVKAQPNAAASVKISVMPGNWPFLFLLISS